MTIINNQSVIKLLLQRYERSFKEIQIIQACISMKNVALLVSFDFFFPFYRKPVPRTAGGHSCGGWMCGHHSPADTVYTLVYTA